MSGNKNNEQNGWYQFNDAFIAATNECVNDIRKDGIADLKISEMEREELKQRMKNSTNYIDAKSSRLYKNVEGNQLFKIEKRIYTAYLNIGTEYAKEYHNSMKTLNPNIISLEEIVKKWDNLEDRF